MNIIGNFINHGEVREVNGIASLNISTQPERQNNSDNNQQVQQDKQDQPKGEQQVQPKDVQEVQPKGGQQWSASPVHLNTRPGTRIDFIRVMNTLYLLGFFKDAQGERITKKEFFSAIGQAVNVDLSTYHKDLANATGDSSAMQRHLRIFDDMRQKMEEVFNSK